MKPFKFIHIADTHLGFRQYNLNERFRDFNRAFKRILDIGIQNKVDFVLLAGDVFEDSRVAPDSITAVFKILSMFHEQAVQVLKRDIPIICIEGNHDQQGYSKNLRSWIQFLDELGLLILLRENYDNQDKNLSFPMYDSKTHKGGMIRIGDACIYGMQSYGSITSKFFPKILELIPEDPTTFQILMMHFGIEGQIQEKFGVKLSSELKDLHQKVDYLALGHFHKYFELPPSNPWIFNPGSLETTDFDQIYKKGYDHGAILVEVFGKDATEHRITRFFASNTGLTDEYYNFPTRAFQNFSITLNPEHCVDFSTTLAYIGKTAGKYLGATRGNDSANNINLKNLQIPVVIISVNGQIPYSKFDFNLKAIESMLYDKYLVLKVKVYSHIESLLDGIKISGQEKLTIQQIENEIFKRIIDQNPKTAIHSESMLSLVKELKTALTSNAKTPQEMANQIKNWVRSHENLLETKVQGMTAESIQLGSEWNLANIQKSAQNQEKTLEASQSGAPNANSPPIIIEAKQDDEDDWDEMEF